MELGLGQIPDEGVHRPRSMLLVPGHHEMLPGRSGAVEHFDLTRRWHHRAMTVEELISRLDLEPHPEGGWFRRTWQAASVDGGRPTGSAIYYLLGGDEVSRRHRVDAAEIWHHYRGAPLELCIGGPGAAGAVRLLGPHLEEGQEPQVVVPAGQWQEARSLGLYSLVGCTVSPAFQFEGFELAPPGDGT